MTQNTSDRSKAQTKSNDGQSKSSPENLKKPDIDTEFRSILTSLFKTGELNTEMYRDVLHDKDDEGRNLIHRIIMKLKKWPNDVPSGVFKFVEQQALDKPELFIQKDDEDKVPLLAAAQFNVETLFRVCDLVIPKSVLKSIEKGCDESHQSCPLRSVHGSHRKQCLKKANPSRSVRPDSTQQHEQNDGFKTPIATQAEIDNVHVGDHCLHDQIDYEQLAKKNTHLREILNTAFGLETHGKTCLHLLIAEDNFDPGQKKEIIPLVRFEHFLSLCPETVFESAASDGFSPLQMAIRLYDTQSIDYDHLSKVIKALVNRRRLSIYFEAKYEAREDQNKTAYRLLKEVKETKSESNTKLRSRTSTEELLKEICVCSSLSWKEKMKFLYWDAKSGRSSLLLSKRQVWYVYLTCEQCVSFTSI